MTNLLSLAETSHVGGDVTFTVLVIILGVLALLTAVWLLVRGVAGGSEGVTRFMVIVTVAGVALRILTAALIGGYRENFTVYDRMVTHFMDNGLKNYYTDYPGEVYPLTFYIFALFGGVGRLLGIEAGSAYLMLMLKIPFIAADTVSALLIYKIAKKFTGTKFAAAASATVSLFPLFILASAGWGTVLSLLLPFLLASFYFLAEKRNFAAAMTYSLAMIVAKEAIYLYPVFIVYFGYQFVASIVRNVKQKAGPTEAFKDEQLSLAYKLPVYFVVQFLLKYIITLPLIVTDLKGNPFKFIGRILLAPIASLDFFTYNGLNIFCVFGKNADPINSTFPSVVFAVCFGVLIAAIAAVVFFSRKNRAALALLASYVMFTLSTYFLDSTPVSVLPALILMLLAFVLIKDKRILQVFCLSSLVTLIITTMTMLNAGYFNMLPLTDYVAPAYTGSPAMTGGFGLVALIICSVLTVAAHLYFTLVTFDITMSNNRKLLEGDGNIGYFAGIKKLFR